MRDRAVVVLCVLIVLALCVAAAVIDDWHRARCARAGGTAQYVGSGGYLCIGPDGRVIRL